MARKSNGRQLELNFNPAPKDANAVLSSQEKTRAHCRRIAGYLSMRLPQPVDLVFTNNRSTMVSFRPHRGRLAVRLHSLFCHADHQVLEWLVKYLTSNDKRASREIDRYIAEHRDEIGKSERRQSKVGQTQGKHHDVSSILDRVNKTYFGGEVDVGISWGRSLRRKRRRRGRTISRVLATYDYEDRIIRVNPVLDSTDVPQYMVEWVVYHELLHHVLPIEEKLGKRRYHTQRFKSLERAFCRYEEAKDWEKKHVDRLLS